MPSYSQHHDSLPLLSMVVPFLNESDALPNCHLALIKMLDSLPHYSEIVYVDDGSTDDSWLKVQSFTSTRHSIRALRLSRNFGKECALSAGLTAATGQAVIPFDADLQDPPECIPKMVETWQSGFDVVEMQRSKRLGETLIKRLTAKLFYKILAALCDAKIHENVGDFRLMDRKVINVINQMPERNRFMKGLLAWPGFRRTVLTFQRAPRTAGATKWNYLKLFQLAIEGITSFSTKPLRLATVAGLMTSVSAFIYSLIVLTKTVIWGNPVAGYPSMLIVILLIGGIQLLSIGLLGEYVGRLYLESKQRPLYVVMEDKASPPNTFASPHDINIAHLPVDQGMQHDQAFSQS